MMLHRYKDTRKIEIYVYVQCSARMLGKKKYLWRENKVNENELFIHQELFRYM